ncbi:MAG: hypothetical protein RJB66_622 [Pseudomonadota bacterium]|jgi:methyl-accepting chemotaxis protein
MKQGLRAFFILLFSLSNLQCANILEPLSEKDSDKMLLYEAKKNIDERDFSKAIENLDQLSDAYKSQNDVKITYASAYAGACGMEFIPFFNSISNVDGSMTIFKFLRSSFTDKAAYPDSCKNAETKIREIGTTEALRLTAMNGAKDINMLMALVSMAKVGGLLRNKSDVDGTNSNGDGTTDASFTACDSNKISDDEIIEVATGFGLLIENLPSLLGASNSTSTNLDSVATAINTLCAPETCVILNESDIADNTQRTKILTNYRKLLESTDAGLEGSSACTLTTPPGCCP